jgi:hypothetical protein
VVRVQIDLEALERLIMRNCQAALTEFGFELENDSPPLIFEFAYAENNDCVGLDITQSYPNEEAAPA